VDVSQENEFDFASTEDLYSRFAAAGFHYGPAFQLLGTAVTSSGAMAQLPRTPPRSPFPVHPAVLDAALHLTAFLHPLGCGGVPHSIRRIALHSVEMPTRACARVGGTQSTDVQLLDAAGSATCTVEGLELISIDIPASLQLNRWTLKLTEPLMRGVWLVRGELAKSLNLPQSTLCEDDDHEAEVFAVCAKTVEDVHSCRKEALECIARGPCWLLALEAPFAAAAAAAVLEVGAQAVVGTADEIRGVAGGLGVSSQGVLHARGGQLFIETMEPVNMESEPIIASPEEPFSVFVDPSQGAKGAKCYRSHRRVPKDLEVEVRASVWALNFRDVLVAVGAIPQDTAGQSLGIGGECYGEVVRVGSGVADVAIGDLVVACPPDGLGSYVTVDARWVTQAPAITPQEAVAGTMVYATAWLGLHWMARIAEGERVLIHSAAGGVGLAAVYLCLRQGCEVYVTASTVEKRNFLISLGVAGAFDSRAPTAFEKGVMLATANEGVDVVLNSLSGEAIPTSLRLLRPFGRFIEIGKRDQYEETPMNLNPFLNGLTYAAGHLDVLMLRQPDRCRRLLEEVWRALPTLPKLPTKSFGIRELPQALEYFSKGIHIGKVLIEIEATPVLPIRPAFVQGPAFDLVSQSLRTALSAGEGPGGVVCAPQLADVTAVEDLANAQVVLGASRVVAALAEVICPEALCIELPQWEPIKNITAWLPLRGRFVAAETQHSGNLSEWLMDVVREMAGTISMEQTFEDAGLDSLALISLAKRLSTKVGRAVSVVDLFDNPTPQRLIQSFAGGPQQQLAREKVVCLHGFRSNKEAMELWLAPYVSAVGAFEWVFVNSPRKASGPPAPKISADASFEWWGEVGGSYETGWLAPHYDGFDQTVSTVRALAPAGIVGFSQGGGIAAVVECSWLVFFSPVVPPGLKERSTPSFFAWDPHEEYVKQCLEVADHFTDREVYEHNYDHVVPQDTALVERVAAFAAKRSGHNDAAGTL
jgi:NADPH:quinone reductase-like Zn-dependent oxidoreductase/aryl carrier-like protein